MAHGTLEKTETLTAVYQYVASRLESVDQRSSVLMVLSGSFVSYLLTNQHLLAGQGTATLLDIVSKPSIIIGAMSFVAFYMSQTVRIRQQNDIISLIVFSNESLPGLVERFNAASGDEILAEVIANQRIVGEILIKKAKYCNSGALLFALAALAHALRQ